MIARPRPATIRQALAWHLNHMLFKVHLALAQYHVEAMERLKDKSPWFRWAKAIFPEIPEG